jgi:hypothetical protein
MSNDHLFAGLALLDQQDSEGSHVYVHGIIHGGAAHREGSIQVIMGRYLRMCRFCMHVIHGNTIRVHKRTRTHTHI